MNQLKEAEKKATAMVQEERRARTERLKEAKTAADSTIKAFRNEQEAAHQLKQSKLTSATDTSGQQLQSATTVDIGKMTADFNAKKDAIVDGVVDLVCRVKIEAPKTRG